MVPGASCSRARHGYGSAVLTVGLTGGVGAGKSTAAAALRSRGAAVVDADVVAREVVARGTPGLAAVADAFGPRVLAPDGSLDRAALGRLVFSDEGARRRLEGITHPLIARRTSALASAAPRDAVLVHDIPLLVELDRGARYHLVVVVDAPQEVRLARLVQGRGMSEDDARARIAAQADDDARAAAADVVLDGSRDAEHLVEQVGALWRTRLVPFEEDLRAGRAAPRPSAPELVAPDPAWAAAGARLVARVARAAGDRAVSVAHTGSTAVPGLAATDCIDLQVVVRDAATAVAVGRDLGRAGLVALPGQWWDEPALAPGRFRKVLAVAADPGRPVNCHVRDAANPEAGEVLAFRDALRADPSARLAYGLLKQGLARRHADIDDYAVAKTPFIREVLSRAR